ncbi:MAG: hypothetical protein LBS91_03375 [Clostridiales Family XIII bacterium]|nr:hypothetical protein [Clostridiales Family XIII bacterium]
MSCSNFSSNCGRRQSAQPVYSYSIQAIDFIFDEICKDPENIVANLKERVKKR